MKSRINTNTKTSLWKTSLTTRSRDVNIGTDVQREGPLLESILHDPRNTMRRQKVSTLKRSSFKVISEYEVYKCRVKAVTSHMLLTFTIVVIHLFSKYMVGTYSMSNIFYKHAGVVLKRQMSLSTWSLHSRVGRNHCRHHKDGACIVKWGK